MDSVREQTPPGEISLSFNSHYNNGILYLGWNSGFFSNLTKCLSCLIELYDEYQILPERIDFSDAFGFFKTKEQMARRTDIYPSLFRSDVVVDRFRTDASLDHHTLYRNKNIRIMSAWIKKYFLPAETILSLQEQLVAKYGIIPADTLVVCMRGTDKWTEITNSSPETYLRKCESLLRRNPRLRVWVQTDQQQYRDYFLDQFGERAFALDELPVTKNDVVLHLDENMGFNRFEFGQYLLATMNLIARCNTVITHTGNVAYWQALYRGNTRNFYQDTAHFFKHKKNERRVVFNRLPFRNVIFIALRESWFNKKMVRSANYYLMNSPKIIKVINFIARSVLRRELQPNQLRASKIIKFVGQKLKEKIDRVVSFLRLRRIDHHDFSKTPCNLMLVLCCRNELARLPEFLAYYRARGVDRFYIVDNDSTDGTREYLLGQNDVCLYHTKELFVHGRRGLFWQKKLLNRYGQNKWCLIIDADEYLVYPGWEELSIKTLCEYLDSENKTALRADLLDMYGQDLSLEKNKADEPLWKTFNYYDRFSPAFYNYDFDDYSNMPRMKGGMMKRVFDLNIELTKVPLIKYKKNVEIPVGGIHWVKNLERSSLIAILFHFKYDVNYFRKALDAAEREQYVNKSENYKIICRKMREKTLLSLFSTAHSTRFVNSQQLIKEGFMKTSEQFDQFVEKFHTKDC